MKTTEQWLAEHTHVSYELSKAEEYLKADLEKNVRGEVLMEYSARMIDCRAQEAPRQ